MQHYRENRHAADDVEEADGDVTRTYSRSELPGVVGGRSAPGSDAPTAAFDGEELAESVREALADAAFDSDAPTAFHDAGAFVDALRGVSTDTSGEDVDVATRAYRPEDLRARGIRPSEETLSDAFDSTAEAPSAESEPPALTRTAPHTPESLRASASPPAPPAPRVPRAPPLPTIVVPEVDELPPSSHARVPAFDDVDDPSVADWPTSGFSRIFEQPPEPTVRIARPAPPRARRTGVAVVLGVLAGLVCAVLIGWVLAR